MNDKNQSANTERDDDDIDLLELVFTALQGKWTILAFTLITTLLAFLYAFGKPTVYKADALLRVEDSKASIPGLEDLAGLTGEDTSVGTELELIKSRRNLFKAVTALKLDIEAKPKKIPLLGHFYEVFFNSDNSNKPPLIWDKLDAWVQTYAWGNEKIQVDRLKVPSELLRKPLTLVITEKNKYEIFYKEESLLKGRVGKAASSNNKKTTAYISELTGLPGTEFILKKLSTRKAIANLKKQIKASEKGKKTGIISLSLTGLNESTIVKTLNKVSTTYVEQNKSRSSEEASNALRFLEEQIKPVREAVGSAEAQLKEYRTTNKTADLSKETQAVLDVISSINTELQKLSLIKEDLTQRYTESHPKLLALAAQEKELLRRRDQTKGTISKLPQTQQKILKLESNYKVSNEIYIDLLNKIQEFKIAKASTVGNAYIVDTADIDEDFVKPKKTMILALGALSGIMLGLLTVFLRKALKHTVDNPEKLEKEMGIPVYATIPFSDAVKLTNSLTEKNRKQKKLLATQDKHDPAIEGLRSLRTSLHFALHEAKNNIVMITGPSPNIGKSFISSNFAAVAAASGQKVILIDADMRKGYLHDLFDKELSNTPSVGLSDIITEKATLEEVIQTVQVDKEDNISIDIMTRGQTPPNPSELLMHDYFKKLLDLLSENYDLVLIDSPPVHAVTDPTIIGAHAGVVFMVVHSERHSMKEIEHAVNILSNNGIDTKGFIFNGYVPKASTYGYGYGYNSYYSDYK